MPRFLFVAKGTVWPQGEAGFIEFRESLTAWFKSIQAHVVDSGGPLRARKTVEADAVVDPADDARLDGWGIIETGDVDSAVALLRRSPFVTKYGASLVVHEMLPGVKDH
jgi:hypothetical protein